MSDSDDFLQLLRSDGVVRSPDAKITPLTGGVSSEIYRVDDSGESFVVKRALSKLRVRDDWSADVGRNRYEQLYLSYVSRFLPRAVPAVRGSWPEHGYFAMELLGPQYANWKELMLAGNCQTAHAAMAGKVLGTIHAKSADDGEAASMFDTTANFHQLRTDPYLLTTGRRHPELRTLFEAEATRLESTRECLVHGDFSPKNMLISGDRLVLLDCEVAWYGDPAFDTAFLFNHLLLKSLLHSPRDVGFSAMFDTFWNIYVQSRGGGFDRDELDRRTSRLLMMLMLARVDGKSPVEYLAGHESRKQFVRQFTRDTLTSGELSLASIRGRWFSELNRIGFAQ